MIDDLLGPDQLTFRDEVREFAMREIAPHVAELEESRGFPSEIVRSAGRQGLLGLVVPRDFGGRDVGRVSHGLFVKEVARVCSGVALTLDAATTVGVEPLLIAGSEAIKSEYLPRIAAGEIVCAFSITEPGAGSDAGNMQSSASLVNDDEYCLTGRKTFCTNGGFADLYIINVMTETARGRRVSAFLVEADADGLSFGEPLDKLGLFGSVQCDVFLDDVVVPAAQLIGEPGDGMRLALRALDTGRIGVAFQAVGTAEAALEAACAYVKGRHAFGKALGAMQSVQFQLADMAAELSAAETLAWKAAHLADLGRTFATDAAMAKLVATECCMRICSAALDLFGGHGYMTYHPVERFFRDAKGMQLYEGTSNIQRLVIARTLLGAAS